MAKTNHKNQNIEFKLALDIPIIAVTASSEDMVEEQAKICGILKVLYKPVEYENLKKVMDTYHI